MDIKQENGARADKNLEKSDHENEANSEKQDKEESDKDSQENKKKLDEILGLENVSDDSNQSEHKEP